MRGNLLKISILLSLISILCISCSPAAKKNAESEKPGQKNKNVFREVRLNFAFENGEKPIKIDYVRFFKNKQDAKPCYEAAIFADRKSAMISNIPADTKWMKVYAYGKINGYQGEEKKELPDLKKIELYANRYDAIFPFDPEKAFSEKSIDYVINRGDSSCKVKILPPEASGDSTAFAPYIGSMWKVGESSMVAYPVRDSEGYDVFPQLPAGNYFLHFYYKNRLYFIPFKLTGNQNLNFGEYKVPSGEISGRVQTISNNEKSSMTGGKVALYLVEYEGLDILGLCDLSACMGEADIIKDGKYEIRNVPPGKYIVTTERYWGWSEPLVKVRDNSPESVVEIGGTPVVKDLEIDINKAQLAH